MKYNKKRLKELKEEAWKWINPRFTVSRERDYIAGLLTIILKTKGYFEEIQSHTPEEAIDIIEAKVRNEYRKEINNNVPYSEVQAIYDVLTILSIESDFEILETVKDLIDESPTFFKTTGTKSILKWNIEELQLYEREIFEYLLMRIVQTDGKFWGEDSLPIQVVNFMTNLYQVKESELIYDAFGGLGNFCLNYSEKQFFQGSVESDLIFCVNQLRMLANHRTQSTNYKHVSCLRPREEWDADAELVLANPPLELILNRKTENDEDVTFEGESYLLEIITNRISDTGKAVILFPISFLDKEGESADARKKLIQSDLVEYVVTFPSDILFHSSIPFCILGINKNKKLKNQIFFIDSIEHIKREKNSNQIDTANLLDILHEFIEYENSCLVKTEKIKDSNFDFRPSSYLQKIVKGEQLGTVLQTIDAQIIETNCKLKQIRYKDLKSHPIHFELDYFKLESGECDNSFVRLTESALLLSGFENKINPTFIKLYPRQEVGLQRGIFCFKVNESKINTAFLISELHGKSALAQLNNRFVRQISIQHILQIEIQLLPLAEQVALVNGLRAAEVLNRNREFYLQQTIENLENSVKEENSFLRHAIAGSLKNLRNSITAVNTIIEQYTLVVDKTLLGRKVKFDSNLTLENYLNILERDINTITEKVRQNSLQKESIHDAEMDAIDIVQFIIDYFVELKSRHSPFYSIKAGDGFPSCLEKDKNPKVYIAGNRKLLTELFDNLVENAEKHAFYNGNNNFIEIDLQFGASPFYIEFNNSGHSFPEGFTFDMFIRKGSKSGNSDGDGFGGWYINEIVKKHNGTFSLDRKEHYGAEISTSFTIEFPVIFEEYEKKI